MLVDESRYKWEKADPVTVSSDDWEAVTFQDAARIYMIEAVNITEDTLEVYQDADKTTVIGTLSETDTKIKPGVPLCVDSVYVSGSGTADSIIIYAENGKEKIDLSSYMNTSDDMTCIRSSANDDGTDTVDGFSGFMFSGTEAASLYVSGNHWIGFGKSDEQLKVCRRDGKCYYLYRSEGSASSRVSFVKLRWEGYTQYNSTSEIYRLIFELFLLDNNDMILNVIQTPTASSYLGTSALVCNGSTTSLSIADGTGAGRILCFYCQDENGNTWTVDYGEYSEPDVYTESYLIKSGGKYYTVTDGQLSELDIEGPDAADFYVYGTDTIPESSVLTTLESPEILFWTNNPDGQMGMKAEITAYPHPQILESVADMSDSTIKGIKLLAAEYSGDVGVSLSYDNGTTYTDEVSMSDFLSTDTETLWESCQENMNLHIRLILHQDAKLTRFKITYEN